MKKLIIPILALSMLAAMAQSRLAVVVNTNGVLLAPTNLFSSNAASMKAAMPGALTTNINILISGGTTNTLCFTNGILGAVVPQ